MKTLTALPPQRCFRTEMNDLINPRQVQVEEITHPERPLEIKRFVRRLRQTREYTFTSDFVR